MKNITQRTIIQNDNLAQIRLHGAQVLDICTAPVRAVLAVVACGKVLALELEPVDDGIGVFLDRGGEDY